MGTTVYFIKSKKLYSKLSTLRFNKKLIINQIISNIVFKDLILNKFCNMWVFIAKHILHFRHLILQDLAQNHNTFK